MQEPYFENQLFDRINFIEQQLTKGEYEKCNFDNFNFSECDLSEFKFIDCSFINCNLSLAKINKTVFQDVKFKDAKLFGLHFENCNDFLLSFSFENCQLNYVSTPFLLQFKS